jgi:hypothetical protein
MCELIFCKLNMFELSHVDMALDHSSNLIVHHRKSRFRHDAVVGAYPTEILSGPGPRERSACGRLTREAETLREMKRPEGERR